MRDQLLIRGFDLLVALILLPVAVVVSTVLCLVSALVHGGVPIHVSWRCGRGGQLYRHWKIRSMKAGRPLGREYWEADRLTGFGRFLRTWHLDELPELFLILLGRMSLVGPRPLLPEHLGRFDHGTRQEVPPGWLGLPQLTIVRRGLVYGREQIRLDCIYVSRRSLRYNLSIIMATAGSMFGRRHARRNLDPMANRYRSSAGRQLPK